MSNLPVKKPSLWQRIVKAFYRVEEKPERPAHGANWAKPQGQMNPYPAKVSMSAFASHGYVFAAVSRASQDLAALPLKLIKGRGKSATIIEEHPFLDLMEQPSSYMDGFSLREQLTVDLMLTGGCYCLLAGPNEQPTSLFRLHPEQTRIITDQILGIKGFEYTDSGQSVEYPIDRVVFAQSASWHSGPDSLYGLGGIQPLAKEIGADLSAQKLASDSARKGRPDILISPADEADIWDSDQRRAILDAYRGMSSEGGAMVLSGQVKIEPLQISPRDLEFQAVRTYAREAISAVFGVPPSILGAGDLNYAVSRQQAQNYWEVQTKRGKKMAHLFTQIAKRFDPSFRVEIDYSGVEALQAVRDGQIDRISKHITNGMSVSDAYSYEGLGDAPVIPEDQRESEAEDVGDEEGQNVRVFDALLRSMMKAEAGSKNDNAPDCTQRDVKKKLTDDPNGAKHRKAQWLKWVEKRHGPAERKLQDSIYAYLQGAKNRYKKRLREFVNAEKMQDQYIAKSVLSWSELLATGDEVNRIIQQFGPDWLAVWTVSGNKELDKVYRRTGQTRPLDLVFGERPIAQNMIDLAAFEMTQTTARSVKGIIEQGLLAGASVRQIAIGLDNANSFGIARSRTIARTEATKAINLATNQSYQTAANEGIRIRKEWLSSRDDKVRDTHVELDGQVVGVNEDFVVPSNGEKGESPGSFESPAESINCRCTIIPVIE